MKTQKSFKIIHTADLHLGATATLNMFGPNIDEIRRKDFHDNLTRIVNEALKEKIDLFLICGDTFHRSDPSPRDFVEFSEQIGRLTEAGIKIVIIAGNHDKPKVKGGQNPLRGLVEAKHPNLYYVQNVINEPIIINCKEATIGIVPIPYIDPRIVNYVKEDYEKILREKIIQILEHPNMKNVDYKILMAHLIILGTIYKPIFYWLKDEPLVRLNNLMEEEFDYIALGHIHTPQHISKNVYYSGSIERINFLEEDEDKSFIFLELTNDDIKVEFKSLPCRPMKTFKFSISSNINPTEILIEAIKKSKIELGMLLRLIIEVDQATLFNINMDKISKALIQEIKVAGYKIDTEIIKNGKKLKVPYEEREPLRTQILNFIQALNINEKVKNRAKELAEKIMDEVGLT